MAKHSLAPAILLLTLLSGCASVHVYPVANDYGSRGRTLSDDEAGLRFFRPAPHVWITRVAPSDKVNVEQTTVTENEFETSAGERPPAVRKATTISTTGSTAEVGYQAQLVMLPDYTQEYAIQWKSGLGSASTSATLQEGWNLTALTVNSDSQIDEMITSVATPVATVAAAAAGIEADPEFQGPGLYRLRAEPDGTLRLGELVMAL